MEDFPKGSPTQNAPYIKLASGLDGRLKEVYLLQMDVAVRDLRFNTGTGWVFGTFAYNKDFESNNKLGGWEKMRPLGMMWGNDPNKFEIAGGSTGSGATYECTNMPVGTLKQSIVITKDSPQYALDHLGCNGRVNGPVDNQRSSCLSCHSTAQTPQLVSGIWPRDCHPQGIEYWFRNLNWKSNEAFGESKYCYGPPPTPPPHTMHPVSLDNSLQLSLTIDIWKNKNTVNSCTVVIGAGDTALQASAKATGPALDPATMER